MNTVQTQLIRQQFALRRDSSWIILAHGRYAEWDFGLCMLYHERGDYRNIYSNLLFQRARLTLRLRHSLYFKRIPRDMKLSEIKEPLWSRIEAFKRFKRYSKQKGTLKSGSKRQKRNRRTSARRQRH